MPLFLVVVNFLILKNLRITLNIIYKGLINFITKLELTLITKE